MFFFFGSLLFLLFEFGFVAYSVVLSVRRSKQNVRQSIAWHPKRNKHKNGGIISDDILRSNRLDTFDYNVSIFVSSTKPHIYIWYIAFDFDQMPEMPAHFVLYYLKYGEFYRFDDEITHGKKYRTETLLKRRYLCISSGRFGALENLSTFW